MPPGLRGANGQISAPPYTNGPYEWDQQLILSADDTGLGFKGAYSNACIDFTNVTLNHSGSSGPVMIRAGTYASPVTSSDSGQSGMIRLYGRNSALTDSEASGFYDRGIFVSLKTTGAKGIFPISGLAEVEATVSGNGPKAVQSAQFISHLISSSSKLATRDGDTTAGMYGVWLKVASATGSVCASGSRVAAIWLDNSMGGTVSGEHYSAFITSGGAAKPDAVFGFETGAGWSNLFYFDETAFDQDPVASATIDGGTQDKYLKVDLSGTAYGIALYAI